MKIQSIEIKTNLKKDPMLREVIKRHNKLADILNQVRDVVKNAQTIREVEIGFDELIEKMESE